MSNDEWTTPKKLFRWLDTLFDFEVDFAATKENTLCDEFCSKENSALDIKNIDKLSKVIWCNPPYSLAEEFSYKLKNSFVNKALLMPARTDRLWFQELLHNSRMKHSWFTGRLHFGGSNKGAFMYNILFYQHQELVLPKYLDASKFNDNGKGGATT